MDKQVIQRMLEKYEQMELDNKETKKFCMDPIQRAYREGMEMVYFQVIEDLRRMLEKQNYDQ